MREDQKVLQMKFLDIPLETDQDGQGGQELDISLSLSKKQASICQSDKLFIQQEIREQTIIKILENGVRLCLKLQTSHIASMFFESWLEQRRKEDAKIDGSDEIKWID